MRHFLPSRTAFVVLLVLACAISSAWGLRPRDTRARFDDEVIRLPGSVAGVTAISPDRLSPLDPLRAGWDRFVAERHGAWRVWLDPRSDLPVLARGAGISWIPAAGATGERDRDTALTDLERLARAFLDENAVLLGDWKGQLALDRDASGPLDDDVWQVTFRQVVGGVPVSGARFDFHVSRGNLVAFGATRWAPVRCATVPAIGADEARSRLLAWLGASAIPGDVVERKSPALVLIPVDPSAGNAALWAGPRGTGYDHVLAWRFVLGVPGEPATWVGLVSARTGEVLSFIDETRYDRVQGGIFPWSSDSICPSGCEQSGYPMPYADVSVDGASQPAADGQGMFTCPAGGGTAATTLAGPYVKVTDNCGTIEEQVACGQTLELGSGSGTDCEVPPGASDGDTHASRSSFYHLNRIAEKARAWLPANPWVRSQLPDVVNINDVCNAFWDDVPGTVNFYMSGAGCLNTGEIAGTVNHEWGHGLDFNDGGGYDNPSEAYADVVAFFEGRESCGTRGFLGSNDCDGYGDACLACTGVRDADWNEHESHTPHTPGWAIAACNLGEGPCGLEPHCESAVATEAVWDLVARDLPAMGLDAATSWQLVEKLFYLSRPGSGGDAYNCAAGIGDGCGTNSWFHKFLLIDDDDANLANGTPHAAAIFAAFDRHEIACGEPTDASNQNHSSCASLAKPAFSAQALQDGVALTWGPVTGAASYLVLRNDLGCDRGQTIVASVAAPATGYTDSGLAVEFPVFYRIQAVGGNTACESPVSDCVQAYPVLPAGTVRFLDPFYGCGSTTRIRVNDSNVGGSTVTVQVSSSTETEAETVTLTETRAGSAVYEGSILTTSSPAAHGDSRISVSDSDTLTVRYVDANDGAGGTDLTRTAYAVVDCVPPANLNIRVTDRFTAWATVRWETSEPTTGSVTWGTGRPPATNAAAPETSQAHAVHLTGLSPCTTYWFAVHSTDHAGNVTTSDDGGVYYHLETYGDFFGGAHACHQAELGALNDAYSCSDFLSVMLIDPDLNTNPSGADAGEAWVSSTSETTPERVALTETMSNSSIFVGTISLGSGAPAPDGILEVKSGDTITVAYMDANDGTGSGSVAYETAPVRCEGPTPRDIEVRDVNDTGATVWFRTDDPVQTGYVEWGTTTFYGNFAVVSASGDGYQGIIDTTSTCQTLYFRFRLTDARGLTKVTDGGAVPYRFNAGQIPGLYWKDGFESMGAGWTFQGEWQVAMFGGLGGAEGGLPDPSKPYRQLYMMGQDLMGLGAHMGDYEPNTTQSALSPVLNASTWAHTKLLFHRSLQSAGGDDASLALRVNGTPHTLFDTTGAAVSDPTWTGESYDVSALADGQGQVQVEFKQVSDASTNMAGWTVDEVIFKDGTKPDYAGCAACTGKPSFTGAKSVAACGPNGVMVSWSPAVAWGTGSAGTYAVYRGTSTGFPADSSHLVAHGLGALAWLDTTAPLGAVYYLVKAESDETCSTGPHNHGVLDDNTVYLGGTQTSGVPQPSPVQALRVDVLADAHVRLTWPASSDATTYKIYRSLSPLPIDFVEIAVTSALVHDDRGAAADHEKYFYKVRAANACGQVAP